MLSVLFKIHVRKHRPRHLNFRNVNCVKVRCFASQRHRVSLSNQIASHISHECIFSNYWYIEIADGILQPSNLTETHGGIMNNSRVISEQKGLRRRSWCGACSGGGAPRAGICFSPEGHTPRSAPTAVFMATVSYYSVPPSPSPESPVLR